MTNQINKELERIESRKSQTVSDMLYQLQELSKMVDGQIADMNNSKLPTIDWIERNVKYLKELRSNYDELGRFERSLINIRDMENRFDPSDEACPGCGCMPGDGYTEDCEHEDGCGFYKDELRSQIENG